MTISMREYPMIKGKDARRFLKRKRYNEKKLKEKVKLLRG